LARWKTLTVTALLAAVLGACGDGEAGAPSITIPGDSITFNLGIDDSGKVLRLRSGDEVAPRLPLSGHDDPGWVLTVAPNPAVLGGGDDMMFFPSEVDEGGVAYHEFDFIAVGPGQTTVTLTHGFQQFTFTVQVAADG
jgi:hypothetical protein